MKYLKMLGLAAVAAMALTAFTAGSASATVLEVSGTKTEATVAIAAHLSAGTSAVLSRTDGSLANTCTGSKAAGHTTSFKDPVTGPLIGHTAHEKSTGKNAEEGLSFSGCERTVIVHDPGTLEVQWIEGTTDGDVFSEQAEVTVGSPFGNLNCKTGSGTTIGRLTGKGKGAGAAILDINAVLNCGFLVPSASWKGTYELTGASKELGVVEK